MCSRYNLTSPPEAVRAYFGYSDTPNFPARYKIAPTPAYCRGRPRPGRDPPLQTHALGLAALFCEGSEAIPDADQCAVGMRPRESIVSQCHALAPLPGSGRRLLRMDGREGQAAPVPASSA